MSKDDQVNENTAESDSLNKLILRLQLPFIRANYHELAQTAVEHGWGHLDYLQRLVEGEVSRRGDKSLTQRIRRARFPRTETLDEFYWNWPKKINRPLIQNQYRLNFIEQKSNDFLDGAGLGKAPLCIALGARRLRPRPHGALPPRSTSFIPSPSSGLHEAIWNRGCSSSTSSVPPCYSSLGPSVMRAAPFF